MSDRRHAQDAAGNWGLTIAGAEGLQVQETRESPTGRRSEQEGTVGPEGGLQDATQHALNCSGHQGRQRNIKT